MVLHGGPGIMDKQFLELMNLKFIIALYDCGGLIIFIKMVLAYSGLCSN